MDELSVNQHLGLKVQMSQDSLVQGSTALCISGLPQRPDWRELWSFLLREQNSANGKARSGFTGGPVTAARPWYNLYKSVPLIGQL